MIKPTLLLTCASLSLMLFPLGVHAETKKAAAKEQKTPAQSAQEYLDLMEAMFQNMTDTAEAVGGVSNEDEIAGAIDALKASTKDLRKLQKQLKALGVPNAKVKKEIDTHPELGDEGKEAGKSLQEAMKDLPKDSPDLGAALQAYGTALTELGGDLSMMDDAGAEKKSPPAQAPGKIGTAKGEDFLRVLNALLDVQDRSADIMNDVTDEDSAKDAVRKIKGLNAEAKKIVKEFQALGNASPEANAMLEKNKKLPVRTKEVVEHISAGAKAMKDVPGAREIVGPAMEEFSKTCQSISEEPASGDAAPAAKADGPAPEASEYVASITALFKNVDQGCTIIESVTDEASAEQATEDLAKCLEDLQEIAKHQAAMPEPDDATRALIRKNKTVAVLSKKSQAHLEKVKKMMEEENLDTSEDVKQALEKVVKEWVEAVEKTK